MYKITRSRLDGKLKLRKSDVEVPYFSRDVFADFSLILRDQRYNTNYTNLDTLLRDINKVTSFKDSQLFISDRGERYKVDLTKILVSDQPFITQTFSLSYELELIPENYGVSSYDHLTYFMPKWSTAHKFTHSNHSKLVEPIFTEISHTKEIVKDILEYGNDPWIQKDKEYYLFKRREFTYKPSEIISEYTTSAYKTQKYLVGSGETVEFGSRNTDITLQVKDFTVPVDLMISGMFQNTFISERVEVNSSGICRLTLEYSKIFNIEFMTFNTELESLENTFVELSNALFFETGDEHLHFFHRKNGNYFELEDKKIISRNNRGEVLEVFSLPFNTFQYIVLDEKDNILINRSNSIYTGKLDALLDLQIPEDVTYNNTRFIETSFLTASEYSVDLLLKDYFNHTEKDLVSVCIKDSEGNSFYLTKDLELLSTEEEIFLSISDIKKEVLSFEVSLSILTEYLIITLNDYEGHNKKSNIIVHPAITVDKEFSLDLNEELVLLNGDYSIVNRENFTLKTPQKYFKDKVNSADRYQYYYLTSDMYNVETGENSSFSSLIGFGISLIQSRKSESFLETTSTSTANYLESSLDLVRKYTTESLPQESMSSKAAAAMIDSSLTKFITYTTLNFNELGNPSGDLTELEEYTASTSTAKFKGFFIEEFPFLYKTTEITRTTSTIPKVEFELKRI